MIRQLDKFALGIVVSLLAVASFAQKPNLPNDTTASGDVIFTEIATPLSNPASGKSRFYVDSTLHLPCSMSATGVVKCIPASQSVTINTSSPLGGGGALSLGGTLTLTCATCNTSSATVTSFSAGTLSPLFTTSVATATTTPALTFALSNAAANTVFGNFTGSSGAPSYNAISACGSSTQALSYVAGTGFGCQTISTGSGTVTSVGLAGTANQITVTGSTPITTSGSWTLSLPAALQLGTDNTTAGTLQLANGSSNAHTIWGSGATTSNTILGFATAPTTGHLVTCTVSGTTCTLTDGGAPGGTGTVTSIATTSPIGGGTITTTGTLTCTTCLTATSPANHGVLLGAGSQAVGATAAGTSGQVLTSNGASADPTFQASSGALVGPLSGCDQTASASAELDFPSCFSSTYDTYELRCNNILLATNTQSFYLRVTTNNGSTYDSGANYGWSGYRWNRTGAAAAGFDSGQAQIQLDGQGSADFLSNGAVTGGNPGFSGTFWIVNPLGAIGKELYGKSTFINTSSVIPSGSELRGNYFSATAITGFKVFSSSGNITSGTCRVYGYVN